MAAEESQRQIQKPIVDIAAAAELFTALWGCGEVTAIRRLDSYDDLNFQITAMIQSPSAAALRYTLKIHNVGLSQPATVGGPECHAE